MIPVHRGQDLPVGTLRSIERLLARSPRRGMAAMTKAKSYVAVYERDSESDAWLVHIQTIPECHTYGRTLRQAETRSAKRWHCGSTAILTGWKSSRNCRPIWSKSQQACRVRVAWPSRPLEPPAPR